MTKHPWRIWVPEEKKMVGPFDMLYKVPGTTDLIRGTLRFCLCIALSKGKLYGVYDYDYIILMRYTAMKDANGKRICENDIVRYTAKNGSSFIGKVQYSPHHDHRFHVVSDAGSTLLSRIPKNVEVIGNIYEIQKLLSSG